MAVLSDLNNHLFAQLDRMANTNLTGDELAAEVQRTDAIVALSDQIVQNTRTQLSAAKLFAEHGAAVLPHLPLIGKSE